MHCQKLIKPNCSNIDTGLSEILVPITKTELFGKALEIQQSSSTVLVVVSGDRGRADVLCQICLPHMTRMRK